MRAAKSAGLRLSRTSPSDPHQHAVTAACPKPSLTRLKWSIVHDGEAQRLGRVEVALEDARQRLIEPSRRLRKPVRASLRAACSKLPRRMMFCCTASLFERNRFASRISKPTENSCEDSASHQKVSSSSTRSCVGSSAATDAVAVLAASSDSSPTVSPRLMYASGPTRAVQFHAQRPEITT